MGEPKVLFFIEFFVECNLEEVNLFFIKWQGVREKFEFLLSKYGVELQLLNFWDSHMGKRKNKSITGGRNISY